MKAKTKKQAGIFSALILLLLIVILGVLYLIDFESFNIFISYPVLISALIVLFFIFVLEKAIKAGKEKNRVMRKNWQLGIFGFFAFMAIPGIARGDWIWATWLVWVVWFLLLIPVKK